MVEVEHDAVERRDLVRRLQRTELDRVAHLRRACPPPATRMPDRLPAPSRRSPPCAETTVSRPGALAFGRMATILFYGDTIRYPAVRHEVPLEIVDVCSWREGGRTSILTSSLEAARIAEALPGAELLLVDELGFYEMLAEGMPRDEAELEVALRAVRRWGIERRVVPGDLPVALADRLRAGGIGVEVDGRRSRRAGAQVAGGARGHPPRPARRRARHGRRRGADPRRRRAGRRPRSSTGEPLTAEVVRAAIRAECAAAGAPAPPDIMVVSLLSGGGHDPGSGPLPAGLPIEVDLWPRDEASGCWADMTRTFVGGRGHRASRRAARHRPRGARGGARRRAPRCHRPRALRRGVRRRRARRVPDPAHPRAGPGPRPRLLLRPRPRRRPRGPRASRARPRRPRRARRRAT